MGPQILGLPKNDFSISRFFIKYISHVKWLQYFILTLTLGIHTGTVQKFILTLAPEMP
jgi:hypothetical protein